MNEIVRPAGFEDRVLAIWREMLGTADMTPDDNFFESGGTSLLAARLASRLAASLTCKVSAADILAYPSVRMLARKLDGKEAAQDRTGSDQRAAMQRNVFAASRPRGMAR